MLPSSRVLLTNMTRMPDWVWKAPVGLRKSRGGPRWSAVMPGTAVPASMAGLPLAEEPSSGSVRRYRLTRQGPGR